MLVLGIGGYLLTIGLALTGYGGPPILLTVGRLFGVFLVAPNVGLDLIGGGRFLLGGLKGKLLLILLTSKLSVIYNGLLFSYSFSFSFSPYYYSCSYYYWVSFSFSFSLFSSYYSITSTFFYSSYYISLLLLLLLLCYYMIGGYGGVSSLVYGFLLIAFGTLRLGGILLYIPPTLFYYN